jgi:4-hydroxybenzoate polyprenyltransferase
MARRVGGLVRLGHPFPSVLNALITGTLAMVAGGTPDVATRLALAMLAIQVGIGAANDLTDADRDAVVKPAKPIAAGLIAPDAARSVAVAGLGIGLLLAASLSPGALALAAAGAATGLAYDLRLKGTALAWLPFAVGIPLLVLFAWWGARQELSPAILVAAGLAVPAGAALAIANALPDAERDARTGVRSMATSLGLSRASRAVAGLQALVGSAAVASYLALVGAIAGPSAPPVDAPIVAGLTGPAWAGVGLAGSVVLLAIGVVLGAGESVTWRQRGWEVQAVGLGLLAAAWTGGLASAGRL